jgi:hypothetical protein
MRNPIILLFTICYYDDKSRTMRWTRHVARVGMMRNAHKILVGKPEGKRQLERPRYRWKDNIKTGLRRIGMEVEDWINMSQDKTDSGLL